MSGSGAELARQAELSPLAVAWSQPRWAPVGAWNVRYREAGGGSPIVLVHGLGVSADYWRYNGPPLAAAGHRVLAPDLPGFGHTRGPAGGLSVPEQARALIEWADVLDLPPVVFVGHSLSCQTILEIAVRRPDRVAGLVMAAPTGERHPHRLLRQALALLKDIPRETVPLALEVTAAYLRAGPYRIWRTWKMGGEHDPLPLLERIEMPGIVALGTRDPVVPPEFARELSARLGAEDISWIEGAAHALIYTHADAFNRAILDFVRERVEERGAPSAAG